MSDPATASSDAIAAVFARMQGFGSQPALFHKGRFTSFAELCGLIDATRARLESEGVKAGDVVAVLGDYTPQNTALIMALAQLNAITVPLTTAAAQQMDEFFRIAGAQYLSRTNEADIFSLEKLPETPAADLVVKFRAEKKPGLIVFSSGSTGKPKGILHDLERVTRKFLKVRPSWRTVLFLMFDHFGGMNTLLSSFAYGGVGVCLTSRAPDAVCRAIQDAQATLLPTTPTFLNLMLAAGAHRMHDLSSIKLITYGTEVMSPATLERVVRAFPNAELKQTYGLSELGVLRSKSEKSDSTWVRIGGDGFELQVREGLLWVRSEANMVGYLNAPSPFDAEGWMCTGDQVEVQGEFMRILGRKSDLINVGGQKVYPAEIETALLEAPNVLEAAVFAAPHPLMGSVVHARIALAEPEDPTALATRLRTFCVGRMERFKIPVRFLIDTGEGMTSERFKKVRRTT